jgi:hypothetical protein
MQNNIRSNLINRTKGSKGLFPRDIGQKEFFKWYINKTKKSIPHSKAKDLIKDLLLGYQEIMKAGDYVYIPNMGFFGITIVKKPAKKNNGVDWQRSQDLWRDQWPNASVDELLAMENKPLVYFRNKVGLNNKLFINWWKMRKRQMHFMFDPTTTLKKELGKLANVTEEGGIFMEKKAFDIQVGHMLEDSRKYRQ